MVPDVCEQQQYGHNQAGVYQWRMVIHTVNTQICWPLKAAFKETNTNKTGSLSTTVIFTLTALFH